MMRLLTVLLCLLAGVAMATPPRVTFSDDRILAATQSHFYVLRDITDNLGSHFHGLHDQHLIEISLDTGEATQYWPLRRIGVNHLETDDFLFPGAITEREGDTYDMMEVLRELGAEPLVPSPWEVEDFALVEGALMKGETQVLTPFAIRAAGRAQLAILRAEYPLFESEEDYRREDRIDFYDLYAEGDWECRVGGAGQTLSRITERISLIPLNCEDYNLSGLWSFHALIIEQLEN
ncbi:hypothetical protein ROA7450_01140 [Roseovarius albus]|uniref:Uncharacterized protein n=1 Tax=Roseovarius albus TaxID=1247867 RepID=A0A1X6YQS8_9RHOB|nr:hypothetical protein [Roseovarius albus]SLN27896.1 hypothetical protein ROA7450_01140 [Roseovarius albus]